MTTGTQRVSLKRRRGRPCDLCLLKTEEQLDVQSLHRSRARLVAARPALINQLRALLLERGVIIAKGRTKLEIWLRTELPAIVTVSARMQHFITELVAEMDELDARIAAFDREFKAMVRSDEATRRLQSIPGIGVLNGTAIVAAVGNASAFECGRDIAAWLGLVPRQVTTGGKPRLVGITKRGNRYLRVLLIHRAPFGAAGFSQGQYAAGNVVAQSPCKGQAQRGGRRLSQQVGQNCLGRAGTRKDVCRRSHRGMTKA
jgi:transposase